MTYPGPSRVFLLLLSLCPVVSGCIKENPSPTVGACADYPAGSYDYGSIGVGQCLAAPTDLEVYEDPYTGRHVLFVVNSNGYLNFSSGSLLSMDLDALETVLDAQKADLQSEYAGTDQEPVPRVLLIRGPDGYGSIDLEAEGVEIGAYPVPTFSGKVQATEVYGSPGLPVAFVSNRLSETPTYYKDDYVYAADISDPLHPESFDVTGPDTSGVTSSFQVGADPYGMAWVENTQSLYVVNESSHTVSLVDTSGFPIGEVTTDDVGLVTDPVFTNAGSASFAEIANLAVTGNVLTDSWSLGFVEGTYRAWVRGDGDSTGSIGWAESGDALSFRTVSTSPVLEPGDEDLCGDQDGDGSVSIDETTSCPWDTGGIGRVSILPVSDRYYVYYEGMGTDDTGTYASRIGLAISSGGEAATLSKVSITDTDADDGPYNDFVLGLGLSGAFDEAGVGRPAVTSRSGAAYIMWYTGTDKAGDTHLGMVSSEDFTTWENREQVKLYQAYAYNAKTRQGEYSGDITSEVTGARDATGYWDYSLERYRLWFVRDTDDGPCLAYAESEQSAYEFKLGSLEQGDVGDGCLDLPGDAVISSPSVTPDGQMLHLWYVTAPDDLYSSWTLHYARGFDGVTWYPVDAPTSLGSDAAWEGGEPLPTIMKLTPGYTFRLTGDSYGLAGVEIGLQTTKGLLLDADSNYALALAVLHGHALGAGTHATLSSADTDGDSITADYLDTPAWDSAQVGQPAYDAARQRLYYAGTGQDGVSGIGEAAADTTSGLSASSAIRWFNQEGYPEFSSDTPVSTDSSARSVSSPAVVYDGSTTWLYYTETEDDDRTSIRVVSRAGDATWTASTEAISRSVEESVSAPTVLAPGAGDAFWHMWFTTRTGTGEPAIAYASSVDGLNWTRGAGLVIQPGNTGEWDDAGVEAPSVVRLTDSNGNLTGYRMYYTGDNGSVLRIGFATADAVRSEAVATMAWTGRTDLESGERAPVLAGTAGWWDGDGVSDPEVTYDGERYRLWYEGRIGRLRRIGLAESWDGVRWVKIYEPLTTDDTFRFRTSIVLEGTEQSDGSGTPANLVDGQIQLTRTVGGATFSGYGATEIALSHEQDIAVVGARFTPGIYVIDTRDDSNDEVLDANYNGLEAVLTWQSNNAQKGGRTPLFSPDDSRIYVTTANPDSIMVFDRTRIEDRPTSQLISDALIGVISLDAGRNEDVGVETSSSADLGPIGLAMTQDGRYLWVANGNANTVYTIDLELGAVGEVVAVAQNVGEEPDSLVLSPDEKYLFVANYVGEVAVLEDKREVVNATLAVIDADRESPTFGRILARIKNTELEDVDR